MTKTMLLVPSKNKSSARERIHYGDQGHSSNWIPRVLPDSSKDFTASENLNERNDCATATAGRPSSAAEQNS